MIIKLIRAKALGSTLGAALLSVAAPASAQSIVNGDFELGTFAGWTITGDILALRPDTFFLAGGGNGQFPSGHFAVELGGGNQAANATLSQTFATTAGQTYILAFDYGKFSSGSGAQSINVLVSNASTGSAIATRSVSDTSGSFSLAALLDHYTVTFTATGFNTSVSFTDTSSVTFNADGVLDNISVSAVPETPAYALMLSGLATLLLVRRRVV